MKIRRLWNSLCEATTCALEDLNEIYLTTRAANKSLRSGPEPVTSRGSESPETYGMVGVFSMGAESHI
jgi:hypothetical protein